jgi:hypothetical protein
VTDSFEFEDDGRRFVCNTERLSRSNPETWWWFRVSVEANARYAPFRVSEDDTQSSVQANVVVYYNALLARRAEPPVRRWQRGVQRTPQSAAPAISGSDNATAAPGSLGGAITPP